jgi:hypothetical protein
MLVRYCEPGKEQTRTIEAALAVFSPVDPHCRRVWLECRRD